jgi:hypothetical protein
VSAASAELIAAMTQTEPANRPADYTELLGRIDRVLQQVGMTSEDSRTLNIAGTITQLDPSSAMAVLKSNAVENRRPEWRAWLVTAAVSCAILVAGVLVARQRPKTLPLLGPRLVSTGWREPLFNGTLNNWLAVSGQWGDATDEDGAKVLAGSDGSVRREFSRTTDGKRKPLDNYRITLGASLQEASAVEVQFGILNVEQSEAPRSVLRIQRDGQVWLASRAADTSKLTPPANSRKWKIEPERSYSVDVQRCDKFWRVSFDGQPVGELPAADHPDRPEFRLAVEGGPAWFSDLEVEELTEK